jgi:hypothetical protein
MNCFEYGTRSKRKMKLLLVILCLSAVATTATAAVSSCFTCNGACTTSVAAIKLLFLRTNELFVLVPTKLFFTKVQYLRLRPKLITVI